MIQRIIPVFIGITLLLSGCAKQQSNQHTARFTAGTTLLKIAHLPSPIEDGSSLFITVDGKDAGRLKVGKAMLLQVPAGEHEVAGYARSLIGSVTIPGLKVTTSPDAPRFVAYRVAQHDPLFMARGIDPLPHSAPIPEKQAPESKPVPLPQITLLGPIEIEPAEAADAADVATSEAQGTTESEQQAGNGAENSAPQATATTTSSAAAGASKAAGATQ